MLPLTELRPDSNGMVLVIPSNKCSTKFRGYMKYQKAITHIKEGSCEILDSNTVIKLYSRKQIRDIVFKRDKGNCHYCGRKGYTLDHVIPRSKGGCTTIKNTVCACHSCNQRKQSMDYIEFMKLIRREVK